MLQEMEAAFQEINAVQGERSVRWGWGLCRVTFIGRSIGWSVVL